MRPGGARWAPRQPWRHGQAGALVQGPARWRPGERARAGKVLRPGTLLATVEGSWGVGHRGRGGAGESGPPWGPPQSLQSERVCPALGISQ